MATCLMRHMLQTASAMEKDTVRSNTVITSYSIHYTKLYDKEIPLLVIMGVSMQFITIALLEVLYKTNKLNNAFEKHEELMKGFDGGNRITSYNVCYTKLLRI